MGFEEGKFLEAAQEIDNIKLDGYEFFTESVKESVECKIYRKYEEVSTAYTITSMLYISLFSYMNNNKMTSYHMGDSKFFSKNLDISKLKRNPS